ncbi:MAG TPA: S41 family peptidase [Pyrinomonadaceae bacterium]|nr:S41 family peptidase [Pyrinomonadaceae bacterium]
MNLRYNGSFKTSMLAALMSLMLCGVALGQSSATQVEVKLDAASRREVIENTLKQVNELYVFPDVAKEVEKAIRARVAKKEYDEITSGLAFAQKLTFDLQAVTRDKHLRVQFSERPLPERGDPRRRDPEQMRREGARNNFGFFKVEVLPGNIGYMDLRQFYRAALAADKATAAMNFLADTDALIIDIRKNGGGSADMVALLVSYLLGPDPVLINTAYFRPENQTLESWTLKDLPGRRYTGKSVYVLTSGYSFSAAEEFAYDLQTQKRATIVGEVTGGGANPNTFVRIGNHFMLSVPIGRAINPITKTNWEGVGVKPDVEVSQEQALKTAHSLALKRIMDASTDEEQKASLRKIIEMVQK